MSLVCVGSARSVWTTPDLPQLTENVPSLSIVLRLQVALQGNCLKWALGCMHFPGLSWSSSGYLVLHNGTDSFGPLFCALPRSKEFRRTVAWQTHYPRCAGHLITSLVPAARFPGCTARTQSQVCHVFLLEGWCQAVTLLAFVSHPGSQEDFVSNWEPAQFGRGCHLWGQDCLLSSDFGCHPSASLLPAGEWAGLQPASSPWVFTQSFHLWAGQPVPFRTSLRKVLSLLPHPLFFSLWLSHNLGYHLTLAPSDCP